MDVLVRIKRLVMDGNIQFTYKARDELDMDNLNEDDVVESILSAVAIDKTIRSTSPKRREIGEKLYIIKGRNFSGVSIYTKGKFLRLQEGYVFYILVSSKRAL